jgi:hypothetical protein
MKGIIRYFEKTNDHLSGERSIKEIDIDEAREAFRRPKDDPLYDVYPIFPEHILFFRRFTSLDFNFESYDYFFENDD